MEKLVLEGISFEYPKCMDLCLDIETYCAELGTEASVKFINELGEESDFDKLLDKIPVAIDKVIEESTDIMVRKINNDGVHAKKKPILQEFTETSQEYQELLDRVSGVKRSYYKTVQQAQKGYYDTISRNENKDRVKFSGIGFGLSGAVNAALKANMLNTAVDFAYDSMESVGKFGANIAKNMTIMEYKKKGLPIDDIAELLINAVFSLKNSYIKCLADNGVIEKINPLREDDIDLDRKIRKIEKKTPDNKEFVTKMFELLKENPFYEAIYEALTERLGDSDGLIFEAEKWLRIDSSYRNDDLSDYFTYHSDDEQESIEYFKYHKNKYLEIADSMYISPEKEAIAFYDDHINALDIKARTYNGVVYNSKEEIKLVQKEEADKALRTYKGVVYDSIEAKEAYIKEEADKATRTYKDVVYDSVEDMQNQIKKEKDEKKFEEEFNDMITTLKNTNICICDFNKLREHLQKKNYTILEGSIINPIMSFMQKIQCANDVDSLVQLKTQLRSQMILMSVNEDNKAKNLMSYFIEKKVMSLYSKEFEIYEKKKDDVLEKGGIKQAIESVIILLILTYGLSWYFHKNWILYAGVIMSVIGIFGTIDQAINKIKYKKPFAKVQEIEKLGLLYGSKEFLK